MVEQSETLEPGKLFIGGLSLNTNKQSLQTYFEQFGDVTDCVVMKDESPNGTGKSRGFGFVTFTDPDTVFCCGITDKPKGGHILDGKVIDPKPATRKDKKYKLFVGGLEANMDDVLVQCFFNNFKYTYREPVPTVNATHFEIKKDADGVSRRFGFLTVDSEQSVKVILENGPIYVIEGKKVEVKKANPQNRQKVPNNSSNDTNETPVLYGHHPPHMYQRYYDPNTSNGGAYPHLHYAGNSYSIQPNYSSFTHQSAPHSNSYNYEYGRGYTGQQQMSAGYHHHDNLYNQTSSNFGANNPSYTSSTGGHYYNQPGYSYPGEQTGGGRGGSPSSYPRSQGRGTTSHPQYQSYGNR